MSEFQNELLVHGYIRENEIVLKGGFNGWNQYIPHYLMKIIAAFAIHINVVFYFTAKEQNHIFITNIDDRSANSKCKAQIISLDEDDSYKSDPNLPIGSESTFAITQSIAAPIHILRLINKHKHYITNSFYAFFSINRGSTSAYLVHRNEIQYDNEEHIASAFQCTLPISPYRSSNNSILYDNEHGLIVFNGWKPDLSHLSFRSRQQNEWKWQSFGTQLRYYGLYRKKGACVMIKTDDNTKKLFVCGGHDISASDMYNFEGKQWSSTAKHFKTESAGICYNRIKQNIFVGGGNVYRDYYRKHCQVRSYDLMKDKWYPLPDTRLKHPNRPIMRHDRYNHNLLYIGSTYGNDLEYIDLRMNVKRWKVISTQKYGHDNQALSDIFGLYDFGSKAYVSKY